VTEFKENSMNYWVMHALIDRKIVWHQTVWSLGMKSKIFVPL